MNKHITDTRNTQKIRKLGERADTDIVTNNFEVEPLPYLYTVFYIVIISY